LAFTLESSLPIRTFSSGPKGPFEKQSIYLRGMKMRYINLLVALVLSFALVGTAACSTSDDDLSGSAVGTDADESIDDGSSAGPGAGDVGSDPGAGTGAGSGSGAAPGKGSDLGSGGDAKGDMANDMAIQMLTQLASKLPAELDLDMLLQMIGDKDVAQMVADHVAELAAGGDETAVALTEGETLSGEKVSLLLTDFIQTLGSGAGSDLGSGAGGGSDAGGPVDAGGALENQAPTKKIARDILIDDCASNNDCVKDVEDFSAWVDENLATLDGCFASFNNDLSRQQINGQLPLPSTACSAEKVQAAYDEYTASNAGGDDSDAGSGAADPGTKPGGAVGGELDQAIQALGSMSKDVDLNAIQGMVGTAWQQVQDYMADNSGDATVQTLGGGGSVSPADAVTFLEAVAASN
jgi:hypothetical protein